MGADGEPTSEGALDEHVHRETRVGDEKGEAAGNRHLRHVVDVLRRLDVGLPRAAVVPSEQALRLGDRLT